MPDPIPERTIEWTRTSGKTHRVTITRMVEVPWEVWAAHQAYTSALQVQADARNRWYEVIAAPSVQAVGWTGAASGALGWLGL